MPIVILILCGIGLYAFWDHLFYVIAGIFGLLGVLSFTIIHIEYQDKKLSDEEYKQKYPDKTERKDTRKTFLVTGIIFFSIAFGSLIFQSSWNNPELIAQEQAQKNIAVDTSEFSSWTDEQLDEKISAAENDWENISKNYWLSSNLKGLLEKLLIVVGIIFVASLIFFRGLSMPILIAVFFIFVFGAIVSDIKQSSQNAELVALNHEKSSRIESKRLAEEKARAEEKAAKERKLAEEKAAQEAAKKVQQDIEKVNDLSAQDKKIFDEKFQIYLAAGEEENSAREKALADTEIAVQERHKMLAEKKAQEEEQKRQAAEQEKVSRYGDKLQVKTYLEDVQPFASVNRMKNEAGIYGPLANGDRENLKKYAAILLYVIQNAQPKNEVGELIKQYIEYKFYLASWYAESKIEKKDFFDNAAKKFAAGFNIVDTQKNK